MATSTTIYVGNLPYSTTKEQLQELFGQYGAVKDVKIIIDRDSGNPKGFAFVEMFSGQEAEQAIKALNETELSGRNIKVNEARPREQGTGGGGGREHRNGGNGGGRPMRRPMGSGNGGRGRF